MQMGPQQALGSRGMRLLAAIIDSLIIYVPFLILAMLAGASDSTGGIVVIYLLWFVATLIYAPLTMARQGENNGQTFGKQWLGLRVVHETGTPITGGRAVMRELVGKALLNAVTCGIYGLVDALFVLFDNNKQGVHDKIASTYVLAADADPRIATQLGAPAGFQPPLQPQPAAWPQEAGGSMPPPPPGAPRE